LDAELPLLIFITMCTWPSGAEKDAECAARLWDALLTVFHPRSPQVVAAVIAEATVTILKGPDHDTTDPAKAFRKWDAAVGSLNQNAK